MSPSQRPRSSLAEIPSDPIDPSDEDVQKPPATSPASKGTNNNNDAIQNGSSSGSESNDAPLPSATLRNNASSPTPASASSSSSVPATHSEQPVDTKTATAATASHNSKPNLATESHLKSDMAVASVSHRTGGASSIIVPSATGDTSPPPARRLTRSQVRAIQRSTTTPSAASSDSSASASAAPPTSASASATAAGTAEGATASADSSDNEVPVRRRPRRVAAVRASFNLSAEQRNDAMLVRVIDRCRGEQEVADVLDKWQIPSMRRELMKAYGKGRRPSKDHEVESDVVGNDEDDDEDDDNHGEGDGDENHVIEDSDDHSGELTVRSRRRMKGRSVRSADLSDVESVPSRSDANNSLESFDLSQKKSGRSMGSRLAKSLHKARSKKNQSVPLPRESIQSRLRNRTKFAVRSRHSRSMRAPTRSSKRKSVRVSTQRSKRRKTSNDSLPESDNDVDEEGDDDEEILDEGVGDISSMDGLDFTEDADEEDSIKSRAGGKGGGDEDDSEDEDSDFNRQVEEEDDSSEDDVKEERKKSKRRGHRKGSLAKIKRNGRRRRTAPTDAFGAPSHELSASEQRERLDFLVKQSAEIARDLHKALAETVGPSALRTVTTDKDEGNGKDPCSTQTTTSQEKCNEKAQSGPLAVIRKEEKFVPPNGAGCELQPHQKEGISWLLTLDSQGLNMILADEMGLGKTIQAVSFLASLVISGSRGPHLVIAPKNVCEHWVQEIQQWYAGQLVVVTHLGGAEERIPALDATLYEDNFDIMVTSYDIALRDLFSKKRMESYISGCNRVLREFRKVEFEYVVLDEAHRLKNDKSRINVAVRNFGRCQRRLLLTGTPLSNNLRELWCLMNILNPKIFSSKATFEMWFSAPFDTAKGKMRALMTAAEKSVIVDRLHTVIRPFFRRRERKDICPTFTSADEKVIQCPLSSFQRALMHHYQRRASERDAGVTNILMAMRAVSNHPFTATSALDDGYEEYANAKLVSCSGKFSFLHYALPRLIASGHRMLIFSQFRGVLDYLEDLMELLDIKFGRLDGMSKSDDRVSTIAQFNADGSDIPIFLLTTRAGGVGLNLQTADTVILFDSDWNPSADLQAVSRIQRIGQKRTVHIMRLVSENSIDSLIVETAAHKMMTQDVAVRAGKFNTSIGAARDQKLRQKDLEVFLSLVESRNYIDDQPVHTLGVSGSGPASPGQQERVAREALVRDWDKKLLRPGETKLKSVDVEHIWIDSTADTVMSSLPNWLGRDADIVAASRAMKCSNKYSAERTYDDVVQDRARSGNYNKRDRAKRARRNVVMDFSELDSEDGGSSKSESDDSAIIDVDEGTPSDRESPDVEGVIEELNNVKKKNKKRKSTVFQWTEMGSKFSGGIPTTQDQSPVGQKASPSSADASPEVQHQPPGHLGVQPGTCTQQQPRREQTTQPPPSGSRPPVERKQEPKGSLARSYPRNMSQSVPVVANAIRSPQNSVIAKTAVSGGLSGGGIAHCGGEVVAVASTGKTPPRTTRVGSLAVRARSSLPSVAAIENRRMPSSQGSTQWSIKGGMLVHSGPAPPGSMPTTSTNPTSLPCRLIPLSTVDKPPKPSTLHPPMSSSQDVEQNVSLSQPMSASQVATQPIVSTRTESSERWILLPLIKSPSGEVDTMKVVVPLDGQAYQDLLVLANEAVKMAECGNRAAASSLCSRVSEILHEWDRKNAPSKKAQVRLPSGGHQSLLPSAIFPASPSPQPIPSLSSPPPATVCPTLLPHAFQSRLSSSPFLEADRTGTVSPLGVGTHTSLVSPIAASTASPSPTVNRRTYAAMVSGRHSNPSFPVTPLPTASKTHNILPSIVPPQRVFPPPSASPLAAVHVSSAPFVCKPHCPPANVPTSLSPQPQSGPVARLSSGDGAKENTSSIDPQTKEPLEVIVVDNSPLQSPRARSSESPEVQVVSEKLAPRKRKIGTPKGIPVVTKQVTPGIRKPTTRAAAAASNLKQLPSDITVATKPNPAVVGPCASLQERSAAIIGPHPIVAGSSPGSTNKIRDNMKRNIVNSLTERTAVSSPKSAVEVPGKNGSCAGAQASTHKSDGIHSSSSGKVVLSRTVQRPAGKRPNSLSALPKEVGIPLAKKTSVDSSSILVTRASPPLSMSNAGSKGDVPSVSSGSKPVNPSTSPSDKVTAKAVGQCTTAKLQRQGKNSDLLNQRPSLEGSADAPKDMVVQAPSPPGASSTPVPKVVADARGKRTTHAVVRGRSGVVGCASIGLEPSPVGGARQIDTVRAHSNSNGTAKSAYPSKVVRGQSCSVGIVPKSEATTELSPASNAPPHSTPTGIGKGGVNPLSGSRMVNGGSSSVPEHASTSKDVRTTRSNVVVVKYRAMTRKSDSGMALRNIVPGHQLVDVKPEGNPAGNASLQVKKTIAKRVGVRGGGISGSVAFGKAATVLAKSAAGSNAADGKISQALPTKGVGGVVKVRKLENMVKTESCVVSAAGSSGRRVAEATTVKREVQNLCGRSESTQQRRVSGTVAGCGPGLSVVNGRGTSHQSSGSGRGTSVVTSAIAIEAASQGRSVSQQVVGRGGPVGRGLRGRGKLRTGKARVVKAKSSGVTPVGPNAMSVGTSNAVSGEKKVEVALSRVDGVEKDKPGHVQGGGGTAPTGVSRQYRSGKTVAGTGTGVETKRAVSGGGLSGGDTCKDRTDKDVPSGEMRAKTERKTDMLGSILEKGNFGQLVRELQEVTDVPDIDSLVDALLMCNGDVSAAAEYIYSKIN